MAADREAPDLLSVADLRTHIHGEKGTVRAVDGVDFEVREGETVCLVGESGSGKSVTCQSLTGIVPDEAEIVDGRVTFDGTDLRTAGEKHLRRIRGDRIAHVFQNPQHALDPVYTVGEQIRETIDLHRDVSGKHARERGVELLRRVGIPRADDRFDEYPHQFSGGMAQRAAIAIALAGDPDLLVADEPTTAVDVTVQARLIELLRELTDGGTGVLWITHDLRVVATIADRVLVMYGGTIVERGPVEELFDRPAHPYTQTLFDSYRGQVPAGQGPARGDVPADGCRFRTECPHAVDACAGGDQPPFYEVGEGGSASCVHYAPDRDPGEILAAAREHSPSTADPGDAVGADDPARSGDVDGLSGVGGIDE